MSEAQVVKMIWTSCICLLLWIMISTGWMSAPENSPYRRGRRRARREERTIFRKTKNNLWLLRRNRREHGL